MSRVLRVAGALLVTLALAGCKRASEQRDQAALEGRSASGTSPRARDDRLPASTIRPLGPLPGHVDGAFGFASVRAELLAAAVEGPTGLAALLDGASEPASSPAAFGVEPGARISASLRRVAPELLHGRVHAPVEDRPRFEAALAARLATWPSSEGAGICAALAPHTACLGDRSTLLVVRPVADGYVADLLRGARALELEPVRAALARPSSSRAELDELGGDASLLLDGPEALAALPASERLDSLRADNPLFAALQIELVRQDERLTARARWLASEAGRERLAAALELDGVDADVPSLAALCEGAIACARSRGLPNPQRFVALATGRYRDPRALAARLDSPEAALILLLEGWPHALASLAMLPSGASSTAEAMLLQSATELGVRVLGFGFAWHDEGRIAYARTNAADLDGIESFAALAGIELAPTQLAGVEGLAKRGPSPSAALGSRLYTLRDPDGAWGWAITADADARLAWLAGLAHDDGAVPLVYVEVGRIDRLLAASPALARQAPSWIAPLRELGLRAQLSRADPSTLELRVALGRFD